MPDRREVPADQPDALSPLLFLLFSQNAPGVYYSVYGIFPFFMLPAGKSEKTREPSVRPYNNPCDCLRYFLSAGFRGFNTRMHQIRVITGFFRVGAFIADGTGIGGQCITSPGILL